MLSDSMRGIDILNHQPDKDLHLITMPMPRVSGEQVLIQVKAAGVNRPDWMQRQGLYPAPIGASAVLGLEVSGIVVAIGPDVTQLAVGDAVCALLNGGGYAEYALAEQHCVLPIPHGVSWIAAAALPECLFTVWSNLVCFGALQAGETVLIHGGGSGIGTTAIQIARLLGARVIVTTGSTEKVERCLALGAEIAIHYQNQDFVEIIQQVTDKKGVHMILDMIGGSYLNRNLQCLATEGRLMQIAIQGGNRAEIALWPIMAKRLKISGSTLRNRDHPFKAELARQIHHNVWPWLAQAQFSPVIDSVFSLADAGKAHDRLNDTQHFGKIILEI
jgi:putative PIG3 family NAD(P)H quinone oxidoreductase